MHDETYVSLLRAEVENFKQKYIDVEDLNLRWDLIKMKIRGFTVKHSKTKSKERKSTETILLSRINDLFKIPEAELNNKHISCVYKFYSCVNLKIVFQTTRCIKSFFPYKDRINHSQQSRVIYRANCWHCNAFYIGKTKRRLHNRETEHFKALTKNDNTSAIQPLDITSTGIILIFQRRVKQTIIVK